MYSTRIGRCCTELEARTEQYFMPSASEKQIMSSGVYVFTYSQPEFANVTQNCKLELNNILCH